MKSFNTFLLLLGLLVIITIGFALYKKWSSKETFVNFQNQPTAGTAVYIPQYSANSSKTVLALYDNLYFDQVNGTLIEVFAPSCSSGCDTTGQNITDITVASRDGTELTSIATILDGKGKVKPYSSPHSQISTLSQLYNQYIYTTSCAFTNIYQVIYVSWHTDTYIHIIDLSASLLAGTNMKSIHMSSQGLVDSQTTYTTKTLAPYSTTAPTMALPNNLSILSTVSDPAYSATLTTLGTDANGNSILYDIANGNIVLKISGPIGSSPSGTPSPNTGVSHTAYNRSGSTVSINSPTTAWQSIPTTNTFVINDIPNVSVIVSAYKNDTVISILVPTTHKVYKLLYSYRFNKNGYVYNAQTDIENTGVAPAPTTPLANNMKIVSELPELSETKGDSSVCGDDLSCKWYWYFNTIAQNKNGVSFLSDDYFLKTEAIPPVCPQCPQCPSGGACTSCGGNGGSGTQVTTAPTSPASSLPPGAITGSNGNIYIPYTDSSGNVRYVLYSVETKKPVPQPEKNQGKDSSNLTLVDKDGQFVTTADPNTLGGGLAVSSMSLGQLGTSGFNNAASVGNNVVDTAGNVVSGTVNTAGNVVGGVANTAANLVGGVANTAANLVGGTVNAATGLVGGTIGTAAELAKDAGSGLFGSRQWTGDNNRWNTGWAEGDKGNGQQVGGQGGQGNSSLGYTQFAPTSVRNGSGTGPVDNYSYYGALQSKGGNYMPVTADFSAFSK